MRSSPPLSRVRLSSWLLALAAGALCPLALPHALAHAPAVDDGDDETPEPPVDFPCLAFATLEAQLAAAPDDHESCCGSTMSRTDPDPIEAATGAFVTTERDLQIPGMAGLGFSLVRNYRSGTYYDGPFGKRWDSPLLRRISDTGTATTATLYNGKLRADAYTVASSQPSLVQYTTPTGFFFALQKSLGSDGQWSYQLTNADGLVQTFRFYATLGGKQWYRLTESREPNGNALSYGYDHGGHLTQVQDTLGHAATLTYVMSGVNAGRVSTVTDPAGRTVGYTYDTQGNLIGVKLPPTSAFPSGSTYVYGYDGASRLLSIQEPGKSQPYLVNQYDAGGRVWKQQNGRPDQIITLAWSAFPTVSVTDREGYLVDYVVNPSTHKITQKRVHDANAPSTLYTTNYTHDAQGHRASETLPSGRVLQWTFDVGNSSPRARANLLQSVRKASAADPVGLVHSWTYEPAFNRVATETRPQANALGGGTSLSTRFNRDTRGNLTSVEFPYALVSGSSISRHIDFQYDAYGRVTRRTESDGTYTLYQYDSPTLHPSYKREIRDAGGLAQTFDYTFDAAHQVVRYASACGCSGAQQVDSTFDSRGQLVAKVERIGPSTSRTTTFVYDQVGNLTEQRDQDDSALGNGWRVTTWSYDLLNNALTSTVDLDAQTSATTAWTYDRKERLVRVDRPEGVRTSYAYNERDCVTSITRAGDQQTTSDDSVYAATYDADERVLAVTDPLGAQRWISYDGYGRPSAYSDYANNVTSCAWDAEDRCVDEQFHAAGGKLQTRTLRTWNLCGELVRDEQLHVDSSGAPIGDGYLTTDRAYDVNGNIATITSEGGVTHAYQYDGLERVTRIVDSLKPYSGAEFEYDGAGNVSKLWLLEGDTYAGTTLKRLGASFTGYDGLGRLLRAENALGEAVTNEWTLSDRLAKRIDPAGRTQVFGYDEAARLRSRTIRMGAGGASSADDVVTLYEYDDNSRLERVRAQASPYGAEQVTEFTYDGFGLQRSTRYADATIESYTYDRALRRSALDDPNGTHLAYVRDANGRVSAVDVTRGGGVLGTTALDFVLDPLGRELRAENDEYIVDRLYNSIGRIERETISAKDGSFTSVVRSEFDARGAHTRLYYPRHTSSVADYAVIATDDIGRMRDVAKQEGTQLRSLVHYDWIGDRKSRISGPQRLSTISFDGAGRPSSIQHGTGTRSVASVEIAHDGAGNALRVFRKFFDAQGAALQSGPFDGGARYGYDGAERLASVYSGLTQADLNSGSNQSAQWTETLTHDRVLNRRDHTATLWGGALPLEQYLSNSVDAYTSVGGSSALYDANGSLKSTAAGLAMSFDFANRPVSIAQSGQQISIGYDAFGRRIQTRSNVGPQTETLAYCGWQPIEQKVQVGSASMTREFAYGPGIDEVVEMRDATSGAAYRYFLDHWGSPMALVNDAGATTDAYRYLDHGRRFHVDPSNGAFQADPGWLGVQPVGFQGRWVLGGREDMLDFRNRVYLPMWGRFAQPDPLGFPDGSMNRYHFGFGNPNRHDPFGLSPGGPNEPGKEDDPATATTHVGETKAAAIIEGLDPGDAQIAAEANMDQDNQQNAAAIGIRNPKVRERNAKYHAFGDTETRLRWMEFWFCEITVGQPCDLEVLGKALHFIQDWVYHTDLHGNPFGLDRGHGQESINARREAARTGKPVAGDPDNPIGADKVYRNRMSIEMSCGMIREWKKNCGLVGVDGKKQKYQGGEPLPKDVTGPTTGGPDKQDEKPKPPAGPTTPRDPTPSTGAPSGSGGSSGPSGPTTGGPAKPGDPSVPNGSKNKKQTRGTTTTSAGGR